MARTCKLLCLLFVFMNSLSLDGEEVLHQSHRRCDCNNPVDNYIKRDKNIATNLPFLLKRSLTKESIEDISQYVSRASQRHLQRLKLIHIKYCLYREGVYATRARELSLLLLLRS